MSVLRRYIAALSSALLLQLTLLGSGSLCVGRHGGTSHTPAATHSMHGATHDGELSPSSQADETMPNGCDAAGARNGCRTPWAPGQCGTMTICTATAALSVDVAGTMVSSPMTLDLPEPYGIHSGPTAAPELPPPRA